MNSNAHFISTCQKLFPYYRMLAEKAMEELEDSNLFYQSYPSDNNIAILMKHISGKWQTLSIAKGKFADFNTGKFDKDVSQKFFMEKQISCCLSLYEGMTGVHIPTLLPEPDGFHRIKIPVCL